MKRFFVFLVFTSGFWAKSQQDSIRLHITLQEDQKTITVDQTLVYHNPHQKPLTQIKLLNWVAAYKNRKSPLLKRKIEDRKKDLYFAKDDQLGKLKNLSYSYDQNNAELLNTSQENIIIPLANSLAPNQSITLHLKYDIKLPDARFTSYGIDDNHILLKYFFLVPETYENDAQSNSYYRDTEETANAGTFWKVICETSGQWKVYSNLTQTIATEFSGNSVNDPEILLSKEIYPEFSLDINQQQVKIELGYQISEYQRQILPSILSKHLEFIKEKTGFLPEKLFISSKFMKKEEFVGIDDIAFWKFKFQMFTDYEKSDLDYFSIISKKVTNELFITNKTTDHYLKNGLKSYLEIQYLKENYPDHKLIGNLAENANFFGIKPLKIFHASKLKLLERYGLAYHYIYTQNLDQKISTPYYQLSNFNTTAISQMEMGSLLNYISDNIGENTFNLFLKNYISSHVNTKVRAEDFFTELEKNSNNTSSFLKPMIAAKHRINFDLKNFEPYKDNYVLRIHKNTTQSIPIKVETETIATQKTKLWLQADTHKKDTLSVPSGDVKKIILNDDYIFPESNFRDNYLYTKGLFSNMKKIKFKLIKDIQNPEYNEIYLTPRLTFNAYDKVLFGLNFKNKGLFDQKFDYSLTPYYSSGTGKLTGSAALSYSILPPDSFFRSWNFGISGSYFHYDDNLAYKKFGAATSFNFNKNPRSAIGRTLYFGYNYYERQLSPLMIANQQYAKYNLWNLGYGYSDNQMIHEKYIGTNIQWMEDFQKISAEAFYRWEFAKNKKVSLRWFAGYFVKNQTKNNLFNYGISRVSNYSFSYGLLGQSATSGILSQQFILAEGGFKSLFNTSVNQFITSVNVDSHVWKWFNLYADAGIYKNKNTSPQFVWDSGIKVKVIPDFLEVYFPVASTLGFEPSFKNYGYRIRYTLVLNLGALISNLRRGVY